MKNCPRFQLAFTSLALCAVLTFPGVAAAQIQETVVHSFGVAFDGGLPHGQLTFDSHGNLFGVTQQGGEHAGGTVFELSPVAGRWQETVLYNFCSATDCTDGNGPTGGVVIDAKGNLYGAAYSGGTTGLGVLFELSPSPSGWKENVIYNFCSLKYCADGFYPNAQMIRDPEGNFYGTTTQGGTGGGNGNGVVFKISRGAHGWTESVLYKFCQQTNCSDGSQPWAGLVRDAAGNLYGTTIQGGSGILNCDKFKESCGVAYELSPGAGGWTENVLYDFCSAVSCADGGSPQASMIFDAKGNLYGTTEGGGNPACQVQAHGCGVVFELTPSGGGWSESVLYTFLGSTDGGVSFAPLVLDSKGNLSGTTYQGGDLGCGSGMGCGVVFKLSPVSGGGWKESVPHEFTGGSDGTFPEGGLTIDSAGHLFGTTNLGGSNTFGVIFELN